MSLITGLETVAEIAQRKRLTLNDACCVILAERLKLPPLQEGNAADSQRRQLLTAAHDAIRAYEDVSR